MDEFICNSRAFGIKEENEVAVILSNFSSEYIMGAISDILEARKSTFIAVTRPNFIAGYEQSFKTMQDTYPSDYKNIMEVRDKTYSEVIDIICHSFNLEPVYQDGEDKYALAYYLYDYFISNYDINLSQFFTSYIINEKEELFRALGLEEESKRKDVTTSFNKNVFTDVKLAVLAANLDRCMKFIISMDFPMETILSSAYPMEIVYLFSNHIKPLTDFFRSAYEGLLTNPEIWPLAATQIKLNLQSKELHAAL